MKLQLLSVVIVLLILPFFLNLRENRNLRNNSLLSNDMPVSAVMTDQQQNKDKGVGPIKNIELGPVDMKIANKGKVLFNSKCLLCHDLDQKKIGPPLRDITKIRTPEFIMNLLLNTVQMQQEDPVIKDLLVTYKIPMTPPDFSNDQVRSVLEYLRSVAK
jgi:cytochrome c551/c552